MGNQKVYMVILINPLNVNDPVEDVYRFISKAYAEEFIEEFNNNPENGEVFATKAWR